MMTDRILVIVLASLAGYQLNVAAIAADNNTSLQPVSASRVYNCRRAAQWFAKYDQIRRQAQMTSGERKLADSLLSRGMSSILGAGSDSTAAKQLLTRLVSRYSKAKLAMRQLPVIPETERLHEGYYQYFSTAAELFSSYLAVQDNLFAKDKSGRPLIPQLLARKARLESLNTFIQDLDIQTRRQFNIPSFKYSNG